MKSRFVLIVSRGEYEELASRFMTPTFRAKSGVYIYRIYKTEEDMADESRLFVDPSDGTLLVAFTPFDTFEEAKRWSEDHAYGRVDFDLTHAEVVRGGPFG